MDDQGAVKQSAEVSAAGQTEGVLWQARGRDRNAGRRRSKKVGLSPEARSGRDGEGKASESEPRPSDAPGDLASAGHDEAATTYGRDSSPAPAAPPRGTLIDVAI